jgi:hypothetical protein
VLERNVHRYLACRYSSVGVCVQPLMGQQLHMYRKVAYIATIPLKGRLTCARDYLQRSTHLACVDGAVESTGRSPKSVPRTNGASVCACGRYFFWLWVCACVARTNLHCTCVILTNTGLRSKPHAACTRRLRGETGDDGLLAGRYGREAGTARVHSKMPRTATGSSTRNADQRSRTTALPGRQCAGSALAHHGVKGGGFLGGKAASRCSPAPKPHKRRAGEVSCAAPAAARVPVHVRAVETVHVAPPLQLITAVVPVALPRDELGPGRALDRTVVGGAPAMMQGRADSGTREGRTFAGVAATANASGVRTKAPAKTRTRAPAKITGKVAAAAGIAKTGAMALAQAPLAARTTTTGTASGPASSAAATSRAVTAQRHRAFTFRILRPTSEHAETTDSGTQVVTCATCCCELDRYVCGVCERPFEAHDPLRDGHFPVSIVHFDKIIRSNVCYLHGRTDECMRMLKLAIRCFYGVVVPTCVAHAALAGGGDDCRPQARTGGARLRRAPPVPVVHAVAVAAVPCVPVATANTSGTASAAAGDTSAAAEDASAAAEGASVSVSYLDDEAGKHLYDAHVELEQLCEYSAEDVVASECGQHVVGVLRAFAGAYAARHADWTAAQLVPRTAANAAEPAQVHVTVYDAIAEVLTEFALEAEFGTSVQMLLKAKYRELARRFPYFVHRAGQHGLPSFASNDVDFVRRLRVKKHSLATKKLLRTTATDVGLVAWAFRHFMAHLHGAMDGRPKTTRKWHRARPVPPAPSDPTRGGGPRGRGGPDAPGQEEEDQGGEDQGEEGQGEEVRGEEDRGEEDQGEEDLVEEEEDDEVPDGNGEAQASEPAGKAVNVHDGGKPGSGLSEHLNLQLPTGERAERRRRVRQLAAVLISKLYTKTMSAIENCEIAHRQPESILYPDDFVDTPDGPVPSRPLAPSSLLVAVVGATTGLLEGVIVNPSVSGAGHDDDGGGGDGGACPPNMLRKLHQVCEGLNSNVRRLNTHADVLADSFALEHAESRDRECAQGRVGDLAGPVHALLRIAAEQ